MKKKNNNKLGDSPVQKIDHTPQIKRLNRVAGQIEGVKKMIADTRASRDIIIQLAAIRAALRAVEAEIVEAHLRAATLRLLQSSIEEREQQILDLADLFRRRLG